MAAVDEVHGAIADRQVRKFGDVAKGFPIFADGDVLFAKITPCMENGKAAIASNLVNGIGAGSTEFYVLRPYENVLPEYVFHFVRRSAFRKVCKANFTGSAGQQRVPRSYLERVVLPLPPLDEQHRIVGLLDRAAEIRRRADVARARARAIIPALFLDMFGDPATNPKGWRVARVDKLANVDLRNGVSPSKAGTVTGKVLTLSAITRGAFDAAAYKESLFAAPLAPEQSVSRSSFLICRGNGNPELVGRATFPTADMPDTAFPDTMIALRVGADELSPAYLSALWATDFMRKQIKAAAKTTNGTYKISQGGILSFELLLPPLSLQRTFAEQAMRLEGSAKALGGAAVKAEALVAALSAEVFS